MRRHLNQALAHLLDAKDRLTNCEEEIRIIEAAMGKTVPCRTCGGYIPVNARFCQFCGTQVIKFLMTSVLVTSTNHAEALLCENPGCDIFFVTAGPAQIFPLDTVKSGQYVVGLIASDGIIDSVSAPFETFAKASNWMAKHVNDMQTIERENGK